MPGIRWLLFPLFAIVLFLPVAACSSMFGSGDDGNVRVVVSATEQSSLSASVARTSDDDDDDDDDDGDGENSGDRFLQ